MEGIILGFTAMCDPVVKVDVMVVADVHFNGDQAEKNLGVEGGFMNVGLDKDIMGLLEVF